MEEKRSARDIIELLFTVVDRDRGKRVAEFYQSRQIQVQWVCLGIGTVRSEKLAYWGLGDPEKAIVVGMTVSSMAGKILHELGETMQFAKPGSGIAFTLPLSGASQTILQLVSKQETVPEEGKKQMEVHGYEMVVALVKRGSADLVMDIARSQGVTGGTIVRARGTGTQEVEHFMNITIEPEKEIVMMIIPRENKQNVIQAVCRGFAEEAGEKVMLFSMQVDNVTGLAAPAEHPQE